MAICFDATGGSVRPVRLTRTVLPAALVCLVNCQCRGCNPTFWLNKSNILDLNRVEQMRDMGTCLLSPKLGLHTDYLK